MVGFMRRMIIAALLALLPLGLGGASAGASAAPNSDNPPVILAFDFSDNSQPASVSNGAFNIVADVLSLSGQSSGVVRMVAIAPSGSSATNQVCGFQSVHKGQVECSFSFPVTGVWRVRAEWADAAKDGVSVSSLTVLRVTN